MSIHPAILYHLHKQSDFNTSSFDEYASSYINDEFWIYESKEAYIESMTRDAMLRHVDKRRRELLHSIENNLIVPMSVPEDIEGCQPSAKATSILTRFLRSDDREAVLGDLAEQYSLKVEQLGRQRADHWFYIEVVRSIWPLAKRSIAKMLRLSFLGRLISRITC